MVIEEQGVDAKGELNRFGVREDFVIPDHAAVASQDFRGKIGVDLVGTRVLGRILFDRNVEVPELGPFGLGNFRLDGFCQGERCSVCLKLFEVGNGTPGQIHFETDGSGGLELWRFARFGEAVEGNMLALTTWVFANTGSQAITPASEKACFQEQAIIGIRR